MGTRVTRTQMQKLVPSRQAQAGSPAAVDHTHHESHPAALGKVLLHSKTQRTHSPKTAKNALVIGEVFQAYGFVDGTTLGSSHKCGYGSWRTGNVLLVLGNFLDVDARRILYRHKTLRGFRQAYTAIRFGNRVFSIQLMKQAVIIALPAALAHHCDLLPSQVPKGAG